MLRTRPIILNNVTTILKFHDFVFSDAASRLPHITALVIVVVRDEAHPDPNCRKRAIKALIAILGHATSLKSLELRSSANGRSLEYLDDSILSAAIEGVASLRELTIDGRAESADFVGAVRSPLTKLALRFLNPVGGLEKWTTTSLATALSRIAHCLEILAIKESHVLLDHNYPPGTSMPTFHAVRSLTLNHLIVVPNLPLLLDLFPNLDGTLHLTTYIQPSFQFTSLSERYNYYRRVREENGRAQEQRCWTRLERLICDVKTLFVLNLRCPIGLTIVHEYPADAHSDVRRYLVESLRDHPPTHLNLQLTQWHGVGDPSFGGIIPTEAAATLTHLTLCVMYLYDGCPDPKPSYYTQVRWDDQIWRDGLLPALESLRAVTHFRLVFHCDAREAREPLRPIARDPLVEDLRPTSRLGPFDFTVVASALADALASLQYCFLKNSAQVVEVIRVYDYSIVERWRESCAWRVRHAPRALAGNVHDSGDELGAAAAAVDTVRELVELPDSVAETIIEGENLVLSTE